MKRLDKVKTNVRPDTTGMRTETFSTRYGQSKAKNRRLVAAMRKKVRYKIPACLAMTILPPQKNCKERCALNSSCEHVNVI